MGILFAPAGIDPDADQKVKDFISSIIDHPSRATRQQIGIVRPLDDEVWPSASSAASGDRLSRFAIRPFARRALEHMVDEVLRHNLPGSARLRKPQTRARSRGIQPKSTIFPDTRKPRTNRLKDNWLIGKAYRSKGLTGLTRQSSIRLFVEFDGCRATEDQPTRWSAGGPPAWFHTLARNRSRDRATGRMPWP
jgi:hypothetical protein